MATGNPDAVNRSPPQKSISRTDPIASLPAFCVNAPPRAAGKNFSVHNEPSARWRIRYDAVLGCRARPGTRVFERLQVVLFGV